ncbi:hypothetical protein RN001_010770 [Aquatica leii]|uniref:Telomeric repeat-binding factor 2-interacting protein 1 n=1 Tax=Aquatica leii TaxID=1421715 RepID=A0AAN7SG88_9COLE|nr:hypothetical protein RN001_010770 [Aquatica leii]
MRFINQQPDFKHTAMSGYRRPYTLEEERLMLRYIIENKGYYQLRGRAFWETMEVELKTQRTWQSLKEHFRKYMYNKIQNPLYQLTADEADQIRDGYINSANEKPKVVTLPQKDLHQYLTDSSDTD